MLKLTRPLCFFDIESATVNELPDAAVDKILTMYLYKMFPAEPGTIDLKLGPFNPGFEMRPENIDVHGITNEDVANRPVFSKLDAELVAMFINGCDLGGFGIAHYDCPLLWEECWRVGVELDLAGVNVIDAGVIMKKKEERSLGAAVRFYCGREHIGAHDAEHDTIESVNVLKAQLKRYPDLAQMDVPALARFSQTDRVDLHGTIIRNKNGEPVFGTRRNRGVRVVDDVGYANWILRSDFPAHTKRTIQRILDAARCGEQELF